MKGGFREALSERPLLGLFNMYPAAGIVERIGPDWDWIWIDAQHGQLGYEDVLAAVRAADLVDRYSLVRVPGHEAGTIGKVLDTGADAVMVPLVESSEEARAAVRASKFPPLGNRSYGGRRLCDLVGRNYYQDQPLLICQLESPEGVANADAITAVDGVDGVVFGPDDMTLRQGLPMDQPREPGSLDKAYRTITSAAKANGKIAGGVFRTPEALTKAVSLGFRLISGGSDVVCLAEASRRESQSLRKALDEMPG